MTPTITDERLQERFSQLARQWKDESRIMSNTAQMSMLRSYQRIIGLGPRAVPLILDELKRERDHWFWALEAITGENPVPRESVGKVEEMAQAWIEWGVNHGILSTNPIRSNPPNEEDWAILIL